MHGRPAVRPATIERAQPKHQLAQLERLGDVVVGAEAEAGGLVVKAIRGGQHEDRHAAAGRHDVTGDLVA